jgi:hypothetical protein
MLQFKNKDFDSNVTHEIKKLMNNALYTKKVTFILKYFQLLYSY